MSAMVSFLEEEPEEEESEDLEQAVKNERIKQKLTKGTKGFDWNQPASFSRYLLLKTFVSIRVNSWLH